MKKIILIIIVIVLIGAGLFHWFEYRPIKIRQECTAKVNEWFEKIKEMGIDNWENADATIRVYELNYFRCLRERGLKEQGIIKFEEEILKQRRINKSMKEQIKKSIH